MTLILGGLSLVGKKLRRSYECCRSHKMLMSSLPFFYWTADSGLLSRSSALCDSYECLLRTPVKMRLSVNCCGFS